MIVQIKYGPIDFQVREPESPLFGGLEKTNETIELQITQEYTGQQRHTVYLIPVWKEILEFDMAMGGQPTPVKDIVAGRNFIGHLRITPALQTLELARTGWRTNRLGEPVRIWPVGMESRPDVQRRLPRNGRG